MDLMYKSQAIEEGALSYALNRVRELKIDVCDSRVSTVASLIDEQIENENCSECTIR